MEDSYIKDYIINLIENTYNDDLERLKAVNYAIEYITEKIYNDMDESILPDGEKMYAYNRLTTCELKINDVIEDMKNYNEIPLF